MNSGNNRLSRGGTSAFLAAVLENMSEGVVACNAEGVLTTFNRSSREFHGIDFAPIPTHEWAKHYSLFLADGVTPMTEKDVPLYRALAGEQVRDLEMVIVTSQRRRTVRCNGQPIFDEKGKKLGAMVTMNDTSKALSESEKRFRTIFEQSPVSVQLLSVDGRTLQVNAAWMKLWGFSETFVRDYFLREYNVFKDPQLAEKGILPFLIEGFSGRITKIPPIYYDPSDLQQGSQPHWVEGFISPIFDENGKVQEVIIMHHDVTEKIQSVQEIKTAKEAAEEANRLKSTFLANMSHELRTPLGAILGFSDLLKDPKLPRESVDEYLSIIERSGKALTQIIDDILDLSKIEAGRLYVDAMSINLDSSISDVVSMMNVLAQKRGLKILVEPAPQVISTIYVDPVRLRQILINLIGNALKFTEVGEVKIQISVVDQVSEEPKAKIKVTDTGIGIPREYQGHLFQPFSQIDRSRTRQFGGTGLGLALSKRFAEVMGGTVFLEKSEVGVGSEFALILPIRSENVRSEND